MGGSSSNAGEGGGQGAKIISGKKGGTYKVAPTKSQNKLEKTIRSHTLPGKIITGIENSAWGKNRSLATRERFVETKTRKLDKRIDRMEKRKAAGKTYSKKNLASAKSDRTNWQTSLDKFGGEMYSDEYKQTGAYKRELEEVGYKEYLDSKSAGGTGFDNMTTNAAVGANTYGEAETTAKSEVQPKVASQMDNSDIKSNMITAKGPTLPEMTANELLLARKRGKKTDTILTSITGINERPTLGRKTLLGG